jgi:hypothetical protein
MTPRQADKIIATQQLVTVRSRYGEVFQAVFVKRDRHMITALYHVCNDVRISGGLFERADLQIVN